MAGQTALRNHLAGILYEPAIYKINFWLGYLPVRGTELKKVATKLLKGDISIKINPQLWEDAMYDPPNDTLVVKKDGVGNYQSLQMKGLIVHECVHALVDLNKAKDTTKLTNEAAAFLAQTIYRVAGPGGAQLQLRIGGMNKIFQESYRMVIRYNMTNRSVRLPWNLYEPLRRVIYQHPKYSHYGWKELSTADGIISKSRGGCGCNYQL